MLTAYASYACADHQNMYQGHASIPFKQHTTSCVGVHCKIIQRPLISGVSFLCRHQVASKGVPSPYEGAFPENIKS